MRDRVLVVERRSKGKGRPGSDDNDIHIILENSVREYRKHGRNDCDMVEEKHSLQNGGTTTLGDE